MAVKRAKAQAEALAVPQNIQDTPLSWKDKLLAILRSDPLINGIVALAITVGFFHGWLKIHYRHLAVTFLFDALLLLALVLVLLQQKRGVSFLPPSPISGALKAFYAVCFLYFFLPWGPPWLICAASARGWCFATLMFILGYRLTKSLNQVKGYFYVLILLGVITAVYGIQQNPESVQRMMDEDEVMAERFKNTNYVTSQGKTQFRVFSTFVSSGVFGNTMAYVLVFAIALLSAPRVAKFERFLLLGAAAPMAYAIFISGSRTSLMLLGFGLLVIAWQRRNFQNFILIPVTLVVVFKLVVGFTSGASAERFGSLLKFEEVFYRNLIPTQIGWDYMLDNPLGGGLGKSSYSIPFVLADRLGYSDFCRADGDLGRLMIELGIVGVIFFGRVLWVTLKSTRTHLLVLRDTPLGVLAMASASCFVMAVTSFPSGSPFLGIPTGALVWFFLGTLEKLASEYARGAWGLSETPSPQAPAKRFLYYRPKR
jgi:hypothetical protein